MALTEGFFKLSQTYTTNEPGDEFHQEKYLADVKKHWSMLRSLSTWGKLPNLCKGQFEDFCHQISGFKEKYVSRHQCSTEKDHLCSRSLQTVTQWDCVKAGHTDLGEVALLSQNTTTKECKPFPTQIQTHSLSRIMLI